MLRKDRQVMLILVLLLVRTATAFAAAPTGNSAHSEKPSGAYALARLEIPRGLQGEPQQLIIALRDKRLANLWFVTPIAGDQRLNVEKSTLELTDKALRGAVSLRTAPGRGRPLVAATATFDLALNGDQVQGNYQLALGEAPYKSSHGTATGILQRSATLSDAITSSPSWPAFAGPHGNMSAEQQPALLDDLNKARPVWRSEAYVPTAYGNAPDNRYFTRALITGNGGGGSSPVVAEGRVFISFYVPSQDSPPELKNPFWERSYKDDTTFQEQMKQLHATEQEKAWVLDHFRPLADDYVVAMDAVTGATLWRTVLPRRSPNLQTHKHRGTSGVPLVAGGIVYVPNLASRLYALDAATGEVKWEFPAFDGTTKPQNINDGPAIPSPLLIGKNLIWVREKQLHALDPLTGKTRWKAPGGYTLRWTKGDQERLVAFTGKELVCYDATTGETLWKEPTDLSPFAPLSAVVAGDLLIAAPPVDKKANQFQHRGRRLSSKGTEEIWRAEPITPDENLPITIVNDRAYLLGKQMIRVLDTATGKMVKEKKFDKDGPGSNAWLGVVGERFLFLPEGQHGTARLQFLDRELEPLGPLWLPGQTDTTAYNSQPIVYPLVDGRLFVRGGDGVYCWDLRVR